MPCYKPLRAGLVDGPEGRRLVFKKVAHAPRNGKGISLPCGRCIGCRVERARQWAVWLMHENEMHEESCFITLTYSPEHLPANKSLSVEACQKFLKRLRARIAPKKIRFFLAGEYGQECENCGKNKLDCPRSGCPQWKPILGRAHYHAILFGWSPPDPVLWKKSKGHDLYMSEMLDDVWGMGNCSFGVVSFDSACYVASYAVKKVTGNKAADHYQGRKPEFVVMSRGGKTAKGKAGGIGYGWMEKYGSDVYPDDEVIVRGHSTRPPRYYDSLLEKKDPDLLEKIKLRREEQALVLNDLVLKSGDVVKVAESNNARRLAVRETVAKAKMKLKEKDL